MKGLAFMLSQGLGVEKDEVQAKSLFLRAAREGHVPRAMHDLAAMILREKGYSDLNSVAEAFGMGETKR